jgi:hypothetical protein
MPRKVIVVERIGGDGDVRLRAFDGHVVEASILIFTDFDGSRHVGMVGHRQAHGSLSDTDLLDHARCRTALLAIDENARAGWF